MDVALVGCGYVGLVTGVCLADLGHDVVGIEIDEQRLKSIEDGVPPFHEPGLAERLRRVLATGKFRMTPAIDEAAVGDVIFLCVQTPPRADGGLDTGPLLQAAQQVGRVLSVDPGRHVVIVRSTVVPGTTDELVAPQVQNDRVAVGVNPEFLREGSAVDDFLTPDRIVVGSHEGWAAERVAELYGGLGAPIIRTSPAAAELAKCASNALLGTLVSFSNQLARIAETIPGVDVEDVLGILHKDHRLSPSVGDVVVLPEIVSYLRSGIGFGGSCLPKDIRALAAFASSAGEPAPLLQAVMEINDGQPERIASMAREALGGLDGRDVTVLGLAFKADTDDLRESPGLRIVDLLLREGARVTGFDPLVSASALPDHERKGLTVASSLVAAVRDADACLIATRADEFRDLDRILDEVGRPDVVVIDGRRLLDPSTIERHDFRAVGRGGSPEVQGRRPVIAGVATWLFAAVNEALDLGVAGLLTV
jgi:nucleotide sugar dehydrogenase